VDIDVADSMPEGWRLWVDWQKVVAPGNRVEIEAVESDAGNSLGYVRVAARRRPDAKLDDLIQSVPPQYEAQPLLRP
jgi:hypothetical protein